MIRIGSLEVDLDGRQLLRDGAPLAVGSRAFDVLAVLLEARGQLVSKKDIFMRVWPSTVVEENNLHVQLSRLRRLLAESGTLLQTVSGRGYRLAIPNVPDKSSASLIDTSFEKAVSHEGSTPNNLPTSASDIIGRDDAILAIIEALKLSKHLTLVGAGGIGKTRLAIEVAHRAKALFADGVYLISLASATDHASVLQAAASALGINPADGLLSLARIGEKISGPRMLFVIDNCEQVLRAAAELAESLTSIGNETRVIATSRGPIAAVNERIYRVEPLPVPPQTDFTDDVVKCSAVQLFYSHARGLDALFQSDEHSHELIHTICRRLDGIPLAIELAAARASILGVETLATRLDDRFRVLTGGSRSTLPQHQTLRATFDWSYALLNETERATLRRLSIFPAGFTMPAAVAVASDASLDEYAVAAAVSGLVEKSLIVRIKGANKVAYGMLQTTRAFAHEKLDHNGEQRQTRLNHANYFSELLGNISNASGTRNGGSWQHDMRGMLDDLRAALTWALSAHGDKATGEILAVRFVWLLFELSLVEECCSWAHRSLEALEKPPGVDTTQLRRVRMQLNAALAAALGYVQGPIDKTSGIWSEVLTSAIALGDSILEARALWGLWNASQSSGIIFGALAFARRFAILEAESCQIELAEGGNGPVVSALGRRLVGVASHYAGDQGEAYTTLKRFLSEARGMRAWLPLGRSIDQHVVASATFARVLWLKGERDEALRIAERCAEKARAQEQAIVTCYVLIEAGIPIALLSGERERAAEAIGLLNETSTRVGLDIARTCSRAFNAYLLSLDNVTPGHLSEFSASIADIDAIGRGAHAPMLVAQYAISQALAGRHGDALVTIASVLSRCEETGNMWYASELHRIQGELLIEHSNHSNGSSPNATMLASERSFIRAINISVDQGAPSLQLRAALSLARLFHAQGRHDETLGCLEQVSILFPQQRDWPEFREASRLLLLAREAIFLRQQLADAPHIDSA
ncbi:ATP-binding protein [Caballeronia sp. DA-9]|uniref:ATP-binding protein n=1 Tax=Caballeronia sp. DA-9 TaxID=3436237 RepID=UPI003F6755BC